MSAKYKNLTVYAPTCTATFNSNRFVGLDATKHSLDGTYTVTGKSKSGYWLAY